MNDILYSMNFIINFYMSILKILNFISNLI